MLRYAVERLNGQAIASKGDRLKARWATLTAPQRAQIDYAPRRLMMVKRILRFAGADAARSYRLLYESLAIFRPGKDKEDIAEATLGKLDVLGTPRPPEPGQNPDLVLMMLKDAGAYDVELLESERDLILDAVRAIQWPTFAIAKKRKAVDLLMNAEARLVD